MPNHCGTEGYGWPKSAWQSKERKMLCSTLLVHSLIMEKMYGTQVYVNNLKQNCRAESRMIRYVLNLGSRTPIGFDQFKSLEWMSVQ